MKLIFVHGRAQEDFEESDLKKTWIDTWSLGLEKSGLTIPADVEIEFPYYGKLLKNLTDAPPQPTSEGTATRGGIVRMTPQEAEEMAFLEEYLGEVSSKLATTSADKRELEKIQTNDRGLMNNSKVQKLLAFIDGKDVINSFILKAVTKDVYLYLKNNLVKKQINDVVKSAFGTEPCVVVGHSLGTVVTYLVLKNNPEYKVLKYITIGSPLGTTAVKTNLEGPVRMPACVQNGWFNAYDDRDAVALNPLDQNHFNVRPSIENKSDVDNHTDNRHGIVGYLNDAVIAKAIYDALHLPKV